jgi:putative ABC transport system ATP-binding protein
VATGILDQTAGQVVVLNQDLHNMASHLKVSFRGRDIGFVFQHYNLLPALTACENAAVPLLIAGCSRRQALARAAALLDSVGLSHRAGAFPPKLSGGEQQRVAIARALVHEPRLVVCDEPTSALDGQTGLQIMTILQRMALREDRAVLIVTHDSRLFGFADRIAHMEDGQVVRLEDKRRTAIGGSV